MRKRSGGDAGTLYAMKVLKKASIVQKKKTTEHTKTERQVLEAVRDSPFLVTLHYAFQTDAKLHLILGKYTSHSFIPIYLKSIRFSTLSGGNEIFRTKKANNGTTTIHSRHENIYQ